MPYTFSRQIHTRSFSEATILLACSSRSLVYMIKATQTTVGGKNISHKMNESGMCVNLYIITKTYNRTHIQNTRCLQDPLRLIFLTWPCSVICWRVVALRFLKFQLWLSSSSKRKHRCIICSDRSNRF
jgi:hypothetical protein